MKKSYVVVYRDNEEIKKVGTNYKTWADALVVLQEDLIRFLKHFQMQYTTPITDEYEIHFDIGEAWAMIHNGAEWKVIEV